MSEGRAEGGRGKEEREVRGGEMEEREDSERTREAKESGSS